MLINTFEAIPKQLYTYSRSFATAGFMSFSSCKFKIDMINNKLLYHQYMGFRFQIFPRDHNPGPMALVCSRLQHSLAWPPYPKPNPQIVHYHCCINPINGFTLYTLKIECASFLTGGGGSNKIHTIHKGGGGV